MIDVRNLQFGYNGTAILHGVHFTARAGSVVAVVGPNGSGKTTLLKCICGIIRQWTGQIHIDGRELKPPVWKKMAAISGYMPQHVPFSGALTVFETILLGKCMNMVWQPKKKDIIAVDQVMRDVGISEMAQSDIGRLSGGERQRVFLAQALVRKPGILFLDEPTSSLDLRYQFEVLESVNDITKQRKMVTIIVLHDLNLAARYADLVLVLKKGNVVLAGTPADVLTESLIRDVYGVNAMVESTDCGHPKIHFDGLFNNEM